MGFIFGNNFNSKNAAGVGHSATLSHHEKTIISFIPASLKVPTRIAIDVYDRGTSTLLRVAGGKLN